MRFGASSLFLKGSITNLHDPGRVALNVKVTESTVRGTDVQALLPGLDLPDLSPLGMTTLNLEYEGRRPTSGRSSSWKQPPERSSHPGSG
jgi:hypothetical protein